MLPSADTPSGCTARVLVIRHAEQLLPFPPAPEDPPLSAEGRRQTSLLAESLSNCKLDRVVCSPMRRALDTAQAIAQRLGIRLVQEPDLVEIAMGVLAPWGPWEQEQWAGLTAHWQEGEFGAGCPGGESLEDVIARVTPVVTRLATHPQADGFALVAHAVVNGVVLSTLCEDLRPSLGLDLGHSHTGVWELQNTGSGFRVVRRNDTRHLMGPDR